MANQEVYSPKFEGPTVPTIQDVAFWRYVLKNRARANTTVSKETYCLMHCVPGSSQCIDYSQQAANVDAVFDKCEVAGFM